MEIGDNIWDIVDKWDFFTLGKQFVRAADSMALNLAEAMVGIFTGKIRTSIITVGAQRLNARAV